MVAMSTQNIREHMPVVCSDGGQFGTVDGVEGSSIKLTKDDQGRHHWIPMAWVTRVDQHVHIDRPRDQAMQEWSTMPLSSTTSTSSDVSGSPSPTSSGMEGEEGVSGGA